MTSFRDQIEAAVHALEIVSPTRFHWLGRSTPKLPARSRQAIPEGSLPSYLVFGVEQCLYQGFYCAGGVPTWSESEAGRPGGDPEFVEALARANPGTGGHEDGWTVHVADSDTVLAHRKGLSAILHRGEFEGPSAPGSALRVKLPSGLRTLSPGFYLALGDQPLSDHDRNLVRLYWNVSPNGAVALLRRIASALNGERVPFRLKVVNDPRMFGRCDSMVLYLSRQDYPDTARFLESIHGDTEEDLRQAVPALTKMLARGVGLAEDPFDGESFGVSRCRLIAEGLQRAHEAARRDTEARFATVIDRFLEAGVSPDAPFLNPGSADRYTGWGSPDQVGRGSLRALRAATRDPLEAAAELGERICHSALWQGGRCTWMSPHPVPSATGPRWIATGPDIYSGSGGMALFLAELHWTTGDPRAGHTALGAAHQCLELTKRLPSGTNCGFYDGWAGALLAVARSATLLGATSVAKESVRCARQRIARGREGGGFDLLSGRAGAIVALLALGRISGDTTLIGYAIRLGDTLRRTAVRHRGGVSWAPIAGIRVVRNLTGLAHGASGAALALLELFHTTSEPRFRNAAEEAFDYEALWFDERTGNWPDFRLQAGEPRRSGTRQPFGVAWCHGAPGIALSRLRAFEITGHAQFEREWKAARSTTRQAVEAEVARGPADRSLCHGFAGRSEILREGTTLMSEAADDLAPHVTRHLQSAGMEDHDTAPGFMLGMAGRGYSLLRHLDPGVPSLLLPRPAAFTLDRARR